MDSTNNNTSDQLNTTKHLPNSTAVLVLGILSIVTCICYGVIGLILGIIALVLAKKDIALYRENPEGFSKSSYSNLSAGRVCAIIGTCLSAVYFLIVLGYLALVGTLISAGSWNQVFT